MNKQIINETPTTPPTQQDALNRLIFEGAFITQQIENLKGRLAEIKESIEVYFPAERTSERLRNGDAIAIRRVRNSWGIRNEAILDVLSNFDMDEDQFVTRKLEYRPTPKLRNIVLDPDSELGQKLKEFIEIDQTVSISFSQLTTEELEEPDEDIS